VGVGPGVRAAPSSQFFNIVLTGKFLAAYRFKSPLQCC
jgi:hypothetical protein